MTRTILTCVIAVPVLLLAACNGVPSQPTGDITRPAETEMTCGPKNTKATCTGDVCPVTVYVDDQNNWHVVPYKLKVTKADAEIIWMLPDGYQFTDDSSKKHGIRLKTNGVGEFNGGHPTDVVGVDPGSKPKGANYSVKFKNTGGAQSRKIKYHVAFESVTGSGTIVCDPTINDSDLGP